MEVDADEGVLALLAAHYVFNVCYPVGVESVYTFLEYVFLNKRPVKQGVVFNRFFHLFMLKFCTVQRVKLLLCAKQPIEFYRLCGGINPPWTGGGCNPPQSGGFSMTR